MFEDLQLRKPKQQSQQDEDNRGFQGGYHRGKGHLSAVTAFNLLWGKAPGGGSVIDGEKDGEFCAPLMYQLGPRFTEFWQQGAKKSQLGIPPPRGCAPLRA